MNSLEQDLILPKLSPDAEKARRKVERDMKRLTFKSGQPNLETLQKAVSLFGRYEQIMMNRSADAEFVRLQRLLPDAKLERIHLHIGDKTPEQLIKEMENLHMLLDDETKSLIRSREFQESNSVKDIDVVLVTVKDFGNNTDTLSDVYNKINRIKADKCPPAAAVYYRLQNITQTSNEFINVAMEPLFDVAGRPRLFNLYVGSRLRVGLGYGADDPDVQIGAFSQMLFCLRT